MNARKIGNILFAALPYLLIAAILLAVFLFPLTGRKKTEEEKAAVRVVRVWNVDTFDGGKGSRTTFLRNIARDTGKKSGVYFLVTDYTEEGARAAFEKGEAPDCISFGIGLSVFAELCVPLPYEFAGGEVGGKCLAYPWCRGEYVLFSHGEKEGKVAISAGRGNLPVVAAALANVEGMEKDAMEAYVGFLDGKYDLLLGTQRDRCRFAMRGVEVSETPLKEYCDLYQYFSVLSTEKSEDCLLLLAALLSEKTQAALTEIGMCGVEGEPTRTPNVFSDESALGSLASAARSRDIKSLENFLKTT